MAEAKAALETMNVREVNEMCEDIEIFDQTFTTMKLLAIFCKVNIDDDLFEQVHTKLKPSASSYPSPSTKFDHPVPPSLDAGG